MRFPTTIEIVYLITSLTADEASPAKLLRCNRHHWEIEIMHRDKDVLLGEDGYTNHKDQAPRNVANLVSFAAAILRAVSTSPTKSMETFQRYINRAVRLFA